MPDTWLKDGEIFYLDLRDSLECKAGVEIRLLYILVWESFQVGVSPDSKTSRQHGDFTQKYQGNWLTGGLASSRLIMRRKSVRRRSAEVQFIFNLTHQLERKQHLFRKVCT